MKLIMGALPRIKAIELLEEVSLNVRKFDNKKGIMYRDIKFVGCAVCGARKTLNIHHVNYIEDDTLLLCKKCHERVHFGKGLEHLNPIGKRQWIESTIKLERIGEVELPSVEEVFRFRGYAILLKAILNNKKDNRAKVIEYMEHSRMGRDELIQSSYLSGSHIELKNINIYTDGACVGNPGPGGYAAILEYGEHQKEISGGYKMTTNNRMEIMAVIKGLEALKDVCKVTVWSDSEYLVKAMNEGWVRKWKGYNWKLSNKKRAASIDLWDRLLKLCEIHDVDFEWVKGHSSNRKNAYCDELANKAANNSKLPEDVGYKKKEKMDRLL